MKRALPALGLLLVGFAACSAPSRSTRALEVAAGANHACARMEDATVRCWGAWSGGQRGQGVLPSAGPWQLVSDDSLVPRSLAEHPDLASQVAGLDAVEQLAAGANHTCARRKSGAVLCWGDNQSAQLGPARPKRASASHPVRVSTLPTTTLLTAGSNHTCARLSDATVWCWGANHTGQLGHEGQDPAAVAGVSEVAALDAGGDSSCAALANGTVWCWGDNAFGQVGDAGSGEPRRAPGQVQQVRDAVGVAVSPTHACALTRGGEVLCWGGNLAGQLGELAGPAGSVHPKPVAQPRLARAVKLFVSAGATCAALPDTRLWCVGAGQPTAWELPAAASAKSFALGERPRSAESSTAKPSGCAALDNGALVGWGELTPRDADAPPSDNPVQVRW